jgi:hypothetical protein
MSAIRKIRSAMLLSFPTDRFPQSGAADRTRIALTCRWERQPDGTLACAWRRDAGDRPVDHAGALPARSADKPRA